MRLVSYRRPGEAAWRAGISVDGRIADSADAGGPSSVRELLALDAEVRAGIARAAATDGPRLDEVELGPPVPDPDKIICVGLNYGDHADETRLDPTAVPTLFPKYRSSLVGHEAPIVVPPAAASRVDYEGEMAVVIGSRCSRVAEADALACVAGIMPLNDVSARDLQFATPQWLPGKAVDTFAPCGPELVLLDEVDDLEQLMLRTRVNGQVVQEASTADMLFGVARVLAYVSSFLTLEPGDVIATGTPAGVGFTREPPLLLGAGDVVEVELEGVGTLRNTVELESGTA